MNIALFINKNKYKSCFYLQYIIKLYMNIFYVKLSVNKLINWIEKSNYINLNRIFFISEFILIV
jgi:hypothetical protein